MPAGGHVDPALARQDLPDQVVGARQQTGVPLPRRGPALPQQDIRAEVLRAVAGEHHVSTGKHLVGAQGRAQHPGAPASGRVQGVEHRARPEAEALHIGQSPLQLPDGEVQPALPQLQVRAERGGEAGQGALARGPQHAQLVAPGLPVGAGRHGQGAQEEDLAFVRNRGTHPPGRFARRNPCRRPVPRDGFRRLRGQPFPPQFGGAFAENPARHAVQAGQRQQGRQVRKGGGGAAL